MSIAYLQEPGTTLGDLMIFAQKLGVDGIDFVQPRSHGLSMSELRKICLDNGIQPVCSTVFNSAADPGMTKEAWLENTRRIIDDAAELDTGKIMLPTSGRKGLSREECRKLWLELLAKAVEMGEACGIAVSIESYVVDMEWSPFISSQDILEGIRQVPNLKVTFDSGNHFLAEDMVEAYRRLAPYIVHVHLKDWERLPSLEEKSLLMGDGHFYRMVPIGRGLVDNRSLLRIMEQDGLSLYYDLEYSGLVSAPEGIRFSRQFLTGILQ